MQPTSVAPRHVCYYPSPIQFQFHHVRLSQNAHKTLHKTHIASNILHSLTATNSCSKEQEEKKKNNIKHPNQNQNQNQNRAYVEQFYSSIDINNAINQTQNKDDEEEGTESEDILSNMWWADLKAALGQRINVEGLLGSVAVVSRERHLALPHVAVRDIRYIDWSELKRNGFQGVVFDKDNTITVPYSLDLWGPLGSSLERCKSVFGNNIAVFSNSAGLLEYDPDGSKARTLEGVIGIKVISHRVKKPAGTAEEIEGHFGCESSKLIMVGDRPFTDIVYGNRNDFLTILTEPLSLAEEPFIVQQVRELEVALVNRWSRQGVKPTTHRLLPDPLVCVRDPPPQ